VYERVRKSAPTWGMDMGMGTGAPVRPKLQLGEAVYQVVNEVQAKVLIPWLKMKYAST